MKKIVNLLARPFIHLASLSRPLLFVVTFAVAAWFLLGFVVTKIVANIFRVAVVVALLVGASLTGCGPGDEDLVGQGPDFYDDGGVVPHSDERCNIVATRHLYECNGGAPDGFSVELPECNDACVSVLRASDCDSFWDATRSAVCNLYRITGEDDVDGGGAS